MGDLTRFSKPSFLLFRMAYLCIRFSHVIIYCSSLLLHKFVYCTLIEYRLVLCSNFSLLWCQFCMFDQQFCECNCSISWVQFSHDVPYIKDDKVKIQYFLGCRPPNFWERIEFGMPKTFDTTLHKARIFYEQGNLR